MNRSKKPSQDTLSFFLITLESGVEWLQKSMSLKYEPSSKSISFAKDLFLSSELYPSVHTTRVCSPLLHTSDCSNSWRLWSCENKRHLFPGTDAVLLSSRNNQGTSLIIDLRFWLHSRVILLIINLRFCLDYHLAGSRQVQNKRENLVKMSANNKPLYRAIIK